MNRAVFLDRDGTINKDVGYLHEKEKFEYLDGVIDGLKKLQEMGYILVIITNQSGIARGFFTEKEYLEFEHWVEEDLRDKGVEIAGSYYCPHLPDAIIPRYRVVCNCRKPALGLFYRAAEELDIDLDNSIAIGDKMRDLSICNETKARGILLGEPENSTLDNKNIDIFRRWGDVNMH